MLNPLSYISKLIKSTNQRELDRISKIVNKINSLEESIKNLESSAFPKKTLEFKEKRLEGLNKSDNFVFLNKDLNNQKSIEELNKYKKDMTSE